MPLGTRLLDVNFLTHIYTGSDVTLNCVCQRNSSCGVVNQNCRIAILLANLPNSLEEMFGQKSDNSLHLNVYTVMRILKSDKSMDYRKSMFHKQIRYFILFATLSKTPKLSKLHFVQRRFLMLISNQERFLYDTILYVVCSIAQLE